MLARFLFAHTRARADVFDRSCHSVDVGHRLMLHQAMRAAGAPTARATKTDPFSPMHRKTVLCGSALSAWMRLSHDDYVGAC